MKYSKRKAAKVNRLRIAKSEGEVRIPVKIKTCVRSKSIRGVQRVRMGQSTTDCGEQERWSIEGVSGHRDASSRESRTLRS
jgi:hypothetical protein